MKSTKRQRLVRPRIERFEEECWFILPAFAISSKGGFAIAFGWLKWHVEIKWPNEKLTDSRRE